MNARALEHSHKLLLVVSAHSVAKFIVDRLKRIDENKSLLTDKTTIYVLIEMLSFFYYVLPKNVISKIITSKGQRKVSRLGNTKYGSE